MSAAVGIGMLLMVMALCIAALYSPRFCDNWGQTMGLVSLGLWGAAQIAALIDDGEASAGALALYASLVTYGAGTAWKVRHHHRRRRPAPWERIAPPKARVQGSDSV
jgi:hypothetical protein